MSDNEAPERIWATVNGMSTRLPDGGRQFIGGWSEDASRPRAVEYIRSDITSRASDGEPPTSAAGFAAGIRALQAARDDIEDHCKISGQRYNRSTKKYEWDNELFRKSHPASFAVVQRIDAAIAALPVPASGEVTVDRQLLEEWASDFEAAAHEVPKGIKATVLMTRAQQVRALLAKRVITKRGETT